MLQMKPDKEAFERLLSDYERSFIKDDFHITARQIVDILGWPAVEILLICGNYDKEQFNELLDSLKLTRINSSEKKIGENQTNDNI